MKYVPLDRNKLKTLIESVLKEYNLYSESAVNLILGTCAQESLFGQYRRQIKGPAISIYQIEPATFNWLKDKYRRKYPKLDKISFIDLEFDDRAATIFCRLRYLADKHPLPAANNLHGLAQTYKRVYNTFLGKATIDDFIQNYRRFVDEEKISD